MKRRRPQADHGIEAEPHLRNTKPAPGNEPAPSPTHGLEGETWPTGDGSAPAPEDAPSDEPALAWAKLDRRAHPGYREHLLRRRAATPAWAPWAAVIAAALVAGPLAVFGAFFRAFTGGTGWGYMAVVVIGPVLEEVLKVACIFWLVERKPWLVPGPGAILAVGAAGGLGFAAIENLLYLHVYFPEAGPELATWRWTVTLGMHVVCSIIAAIGIARMWQDVFAVGRPAQVAIAARWLFAAMIVHGAYNAFAIAMELFEWVEPAW